MNTTTIKLSTRPTSRELRKALMYEPPSTHTLTNIREGEHGIYLTFTEPGQEAPKEKPQSMFMKVHKSKCSIIYCLDPAEWQDQDGILYCTWHATQNKQPDRIYTAA